MRAKRITNIKQIQQNITGICYWSYLTTKVLTSYRKSSRTIMYNTRYREDWWHSSFMFHRWRHACKVSKATKKFQQELIREKSIKIKNTLQTYVWRIILAIYQVQRKRKYNSIIHWLIEKARWQGSTMNYGKTDTIKLQIRNIWCREQKQLTWSQ